MWCAATPTVHPSAAVVFFQSASVSFSRRAVASCTLASSCLAYASPLAPMVCPPSVCVPHCIDERRDSRSTGPVTDLAFLRCRKKAGRCRWVPATPGASVVDRLILGDQAAALRREGDSAGQAFAQGPGVLRAAAAALRQVARVRLAFRTLAETPRRGR